MLLRYAFDMSRASQALRGAPLVSPYRRPLRQPGEPRRARSPWIRLGLAATIVATLPFAWSEDFKCEQGPQPLVSGGDILFGKNMEEPRPALLFFGVLALGVALGFAAARTARPWRRFVSHVTAGAAALVSTFMCLLMMTHGRSDQPLDHPAAWIGTLSSFAIAIQTWWLSGEALRDALERRAARRRAARGRARAARDAQLTRPRIEAMFTLEERERDELAAEEATAEVEGPIARRQL
jgi:hypothetical protein